MAWRRHCRGFAGRQLPVLGLARSALPARAGLSQCALDLADPAALTAWLAGPTLHDWLADASAVWLVNNAGQVQPIAALGEQDPQAIVQAINSTSPPAIAQQCRAGCQPALC